MKITFLVLCCVFGNYGDNFTSTTVQESNTVVTFRISIIEENARCKSKNKELILDEGSIVVLNVSSIRIPSKDGNMRPHNIDNAKCILINGSGEYKLGEEYKLIEENRPWEEKHTVTNDMYGTWSCKLKYNKNTYLAEIKPVEHNGPFSYSYVICNVTIKKPDVPTPVIPDGNKSNEPMNGKLWYILGGVGAVVLLIIIGQTIALCYFRRQALPQRRMDAMTSRRNQFDGGDRARYSAPPCKKDKSSARTDADRDSHIYEMVGVNALYNKSSDLNHQDSIGTAERNIRNRSPLPLPHEMPKPVSTETLSQLPSPGKKPTLSSMPSTLSLNSTGSSNTLLSKKKGKESSPGQGYKKAPALPPKHVDEQPIPGSLRRPAMLRPAPAHPSTATDSPVSELKTIFKRRNKGIDPSSPAATSERQPPKEPPKIQAKPSTLTKPPRKQPITVSTSVANQSNQIKLIIPKIEASLKSPKPMFPKAAEAVPSPVKSPPPPKKPSQVVSKPLTQKPVTQKPVAQPAPKLVQNRPLPTPGSSRQLPPEPISLQPIPSLPPRNQEYSEDKSQDTDDDEEWTYEPLGQYNLYNM